MKANRKFIEKEAGVSAVIGVILMVAITVAIAATVYVYVSGMLGAGPAVAPTISMSQNGNYIYINSVQNGPVSLGTNPATASCVNITGSSTGLGASINDIDTSGDVSGGDTITITGYTPGDTYTVTITYNDQAVGTATFKPTA